MNRVTKLNYKQLETNPFKSTQAKRQKLKLVAKWQMEDGKLVCKWKSVD